ncbi:hypothetical protein D9M68_984580 [compost metagenome]
MARRLITSVMAPVSARSVLRNLRRAGTLAKRFLTSITVPRFIASGMGPDLTPALTSTLRPLSASAGREATLSSATEPIEASASPRKPSERISSR